MFSLPNIDLCSAIFNENTASFLLDWIMYMKRKIGRCLLLDHMLGFFGGGGGACI